MKILFFLLLFLAACESAEQQRKGNDSLPTENASYEKDDDSFTAQTHYLRDDNRARLKTDIATTRGSGAEINNSL